MLIVRHDAQVVGTLAAQERELIFRYDAAWLARPQAFPLSTRLPLQVAPHAGEEVLSFFANLLPEGRVLDTLCKLQRLPRGNVYRLLEAFGRECAGAFELVADMGDEPRKPSYEPYPPDRLAADLAALRDNVPLLQRHGELRLSLAGAQNKIPVRYADGVLGLPAGGAASTHILKPALQPEKLYPDSVLNEALCMRLAQAAGLPVANVELLRLPEPVLLVERFDRVIEADHVHRLHQLDFCQLAGVLPDQKYEADGGPGMADLFRLVDAHSALPARDRLQLVDWLLFNYLIGNADAHAKNMAMRYERSGRLRLAPAYDLVSTSYWPALDDGLAMAVGGERRPGWVMPRHWQALCDACGLNFTLVRRRAMSVAETLLDRLPATAANLGLEPQTPLAGHVQETIARRHDFLRRSQPD
jgi:serine/threonine-protein kinase HipA